MMETWWLGNSAVSWPHRYPFSNRLSARFGKVFVTVAYRRLFLTVKKRLAVILTSLSSIVSVLLIAVPLLALYNKE